MEKLIFILTWFSAGLIAPIFNSVCLANEFSFHFEKLGRFEIETHQLKKTKIGGLSAAFFLQDKLYVLSDDRGRVNEPRFYVFTVKLKTEEGKLKPQVDPEKVIFVKTNLKNDKPYLDGEGFVSLNENRFLISSEGDNNSKPRKPPQIFEIDSVGNYLRDWKLPEEVIPESLGEQKKGIQNNAGFEGLTLSADGKDVLAVVERQLVQDYKKTNSKDLKEETSFARFYKFKSIHREQNFSVDKNQDLDVETYYYELNPLGIMSGISEVLYLKDKKYLVMERGVRAKLDSGVSYATTLSWIDLNEFKTLSNKKILKSNKLKFDFGDENFEVLAWGPAWGKYSRTLWIMNDNNFSKREKNIFHVYGVEEIK